MTALLTVSQLNKSYGGVRATDDLNLEVMNGRITRGDWTKWCGENNADFTTEW